MQTRSNAAGRRLIVVAGLAALAACGGGGGGGGSATSNTDATANGSATPATGSATPATGSTTPAAGTTGTPPGAATGALVTSDGVMTRGSIIVNGVRYDDSAATIRIDDRAGTIAELADGMVVKLRGRVNDDGVSGRADLVEVENEVRGLVQSVDLAASPARLVVGGLTVLIEDSTVLANLPAGLAALVPGTTYLEVHGQRDASGVVRASRIEPQTRGAPGLLDELRGTVSAAQPGAFSLGAVRVTYGASTAFTPAGLTAAALADGTVVEVHGAFTGSTTFAASRIDFEDREDDGFRRGDNERGQTEGFVTGLDAAARRFVLQGRTVQYAAGTQFRNGTAADLANDRRVEVSGTFSGGVLVAREISFRQARVRLEGLATQVDAARRTITVLGQSVRIDDRTRVDARRSGGGGGGGSGGLADIAAGVDCVEVRARQVGTALVADEVDEQSSCDVGRDRVRGPVTAENEAASTLTLLGSVNATLAGTTVFRSLSGAALSRAQFFAAVVPTSRTIVQLRGTYAGGVLRVTEAEIED